jgi:hypothetical protein
MNIGFDQPLYVQPFDFRAAATDGFITAALAKKSGQDDLFEKASGKR